MSSRMDRYYDKYEDNKRTDKNSKLYDELYDKKDYSDIESASLDVGKEINLEDIKNLLNKRESYNELRDYRIVKEEEKPVQRVVEHIPDSNNHDINEMLTKAREEKPQEERVRSLADTQVITLQELVSKKSYAKKEVLNKEDVKDLINTIYDTNLLSSDDGDLFDDLKSTGKTTVSPSIKQVLDDAKKEMEADMDNSFFTSSLGFKNEDLRNETEEIEESDDKTTAFLIVLGVIFILIVIFIIFKFVIF